MIAAMQMYDWPEIHDRTDRFWTAVASNLRAEGLEAPEHLSRPDDLAAPWTRADLVLGQTCGLPFVSGRCGTAQIVGRPDFGVEGAEAGTYRSAIICRADDPRTLGEFRGTHGVINEFGSQSGCNALADEIQRQKLDDNRPFFGQLSLSGAHRNSAQMVADRQADIAAIDAVAWALFAELEPVRHARLRILGWTRAMPALPFITAETNRTHKPVIYGAVLAAALAANQTGLPVDIFPADSNDYDPIRKMAARIAGMKLAPEQPAL